MSHLIRSQNISHAHDVSNLVESTNSFSEDSVETQKPKFVDAEFHQSEISRIKEECQLAVKQAKKEGIEQGLKDGEMIGLEKGQHATKEQAIELARVEIFDEYKETTDEVVLRSEKLAELLNKLEQRVIDAFESFEPVAVEIVYEVLLKIIGNRAVEKKLVEDVLIQCINKCASTKIIKIRMSFDDYQCVMTDNFEQDISNLLKHIEVVPDVKILPGGCIVETESGNLDARLDSQLEIFKKYLLEVHKKRQNEEGTLA